MDNPTTKHTKEYLSDPNNLDNVNYEHKEENEMTTEEIGKAFRVTITNRVDTEKDLILGPGVHINPPPES